MCYIHQMKVSSCFIIIVVTIQKPKPLSLISSEILLFAIAIRRVIIPYSLNKYRTRASTIGCYPAANFNGSFLSLPSFSKYPNASHITTQRFILIVNAWPIAQAYYQLVFKFKVSHILYLPIKLTHIPLPCNSTFIIMAHSFPVPSESGW